MSEIGAQEIPRSAGAGARTRFHWPTFAADAALVSGGALAANVLNYVFHFVLSRRLGAEGYGALATLLAIAMLAGVVGSAVGTLAMQKTARLWALHEDRRISSLTAALIRPVFFLAAALGTAAAVLAFPLSRFLHETDALAWAALALAISLGIIAAYGRGAVQGAHRFTFYAGSLVAESAMKLLLGFALVAGGFAVGGAMLGAAGGLVVGALIAFLPLRTAGKTQRIEMQSVRALGASAVPVGSIYACSMALLFVDTIFAKHALTGQEAGYYTAAGLIARIIPFGVNLIVPLIMPKAVAARHTSHAALARLLAVTFSIAAAGVAVALLTMELLPKALVTLTFGGAFLPAASLLRLYAIDTALIALGALGYTYLAAIGEYAVSGWLVAAVIGEAAVMAVWGTSATALLHIAIAGNALVLPVVAFLVWRSLAHAPQALATLVAEALPTASTVPEFPTA